MYNKINPTHTIGPLSAFFLPQVMQIGIGFLSFQQIITKFSEQDGWLATLISGLSTLFVMWIILRLLENERHFGRPDIFSIHRRIFGPWIGNVLTFILMSHVLLFSFAFLRSYIEILQVWIFPQLNSFTFSIIFCCIVWYIVMGGLRTISGVCLLSFIYLIPLFILSIFIVPHAHYENLMPLFDHTPLSIMRSCYETTHDYLGFELILYFYPFISQPEKARKWAFRGVLTTIYIYTTILLLGIIYFSQGEMQNTIWPTITYWKSVRFPLFEHVDIIAIVILLWVLIPNICLCSWILARGIKFTFPAIKMKHSLIGILVVLITITCMVKNGLQVRTINNIYNGFGFIIIYFYLPLLLFCQWIKKKIGRQSA
ncbi:MAG: GerAB/ArcD/ProY family transporter [Sporolactobacillus sp.]|uniref:GerAB/ArcD/ProY family transporter n=1 Tax=Sporolactobacillus sp. STSJ-5 TaxID=2965076 RepID=UPI002106DB01|nr:GerAB/ArcD/ProY family transporter [Sporolactobacillus sp. STSJ-5]MCQ2008715.1 spore germination protein [Sporolactobacillus sp. STSJ-5]